MTTNGYLLSPERLERQVALGITSYQISLDGWGETHDNSRVRSDGGATFERIWRNLLRARETDLRFKITLRVHFSPLNWQGLPKLLDAIREHFDGDERFRVFFKAVGRYGGSNDGKMQVFSKEQQSHLHGQLMERLGKGVKASNLDSAPTYVCYASQPNSLVVRADGSLVKCTVALNEAPNQVGHLNPDGTLSVQTERMQQWFVGIEKMDAKILSCPLDTVSRAHRAASEEAGRVRLNVVS
jgi:uncharacterized protein